MPGEKNSRARTIRLERQPLGAERAFLPAIAKGLGITARRFFENTFGRKKTATIEYPDVRPTVPPRFRGLHMLTHRDDGSVRCVACMMCPTVCPAHCITIVPGERPDSAEKFPVVFEIDELRCVVCGLCVEVCPCDAIRMDSGVHAPPVEGRSQGVFHKIDLMKHGKASTAVQGGEPPDWREKVSVDAERGPDSKLPAAPR